MGIPDRLKALRAAMKNKNVDAIIIPSSDSHQSEYVAAHWQARTWISGFTGSAGTVVISQEKAGLWADSRYFLQAEEELSGTGIELQKMHNPAKPGIIPWLKTQLPEGGKLSLNGLQFSESQLRQYRRKLKSANIEIVTELDLVGEAWEDRPSLPKEPVFEHDVKYAGKSREDKLAEVRRHMKSMKVEHYLLTALDEIAWLFNLRGADVACNPVFYAYTLVSMDACHLFVQSSKVPQDIRGKLEKSGISLHEYDAVLDFCESLPEGYVLTQPGLINAQLYSKLPLKQVIEGPNIVRRLKAIKNETEVEHIREAMRKDGVALLRMYRWLDAQLDKGETITEAALAERLNQFRGEQDLYVGESFNAIVGYRGNGAIVHYRPMPETSASIRKEGVLLLDSGGQYIDGTTDITRTTSWGPVGEAEKQAYTRVLKGHIALDMIQFPEGTTGAQLDVLARMHLWNHGLNYGHGTGHGVGFFLNVHEPPQGFVASVSVERGNTPFKPGMLTSNEPGYYETGEFGIRIENLVLCVPGADTPSGKFLKFETLTLFPIELDMVKRDLLTNEEISWLNNYHKKVYDEIAPRLKEEERFWLEERCRAIH
ncbi:MAG: aminopeptidase P family protein [Bacteroidetes bacterium]|nr:aminopeptidase P family protein [Bacteroidota bacterium]